MSEAGEVTNRRTERTRETILLNLQKTQPLKVKESLRYVTSETIPANEEMFKQRAFLEPTWVLNMEDNSIDIAVIDLYTKSSIENMESKYTAFTEIIILAQSRGLCVYSNNGNSPENLLDSSLISLR